MAAVPLLSDTTKQTSLDEFIHNFSMDTSFCSRTTSSITNTKEYFPGLMIEVLFSKPDQNATF